MLRLCIKDSTQAKVLCGRLMHDRPCSILAVDLETTGLNPAKDSIVGLSLCGDVNGPSAWVSREAVPDWVSIFKPLLETVPLVNHNGIGFDGPFLQAAGVNAQYAEDTLPLAYATGWWSEQLAGHALSLKVLAKNVLEYDMIQLKALFAAHGVADKDFSKLPHDAPDVLQYTTDDAWCALRLWYALKGELETRQGVSMIYRLEKKLIPISNSIEALGCKLDLDYLSNQRIRVEHLSTMLEQWLKEQAGLRRNFNLDSSKQLGRLLYDDWRLTALALTDKGGRSVDEHTLTLLAGRLGHDAIPGNPRVRVQDWLEAYLVMKGLHKCMGTYLAGMPELADADGTLRTIYRQFGAASGRFTSAEPNIQNIPRYATIELPAPLVSVVPSIDIDVRRAFVARPDCYYIDSDYNAIESRIQASSSNDANYLKVFTSGGDIHTHTASLIFGIGIPEVSKDQRQQTKTVVYGWSYGQGHKMMAKRNHLTETVVKRLLRKLEAAFPELVAWKADIIARWYEHDGWCYTYFGRPRYIPTCKSPDRKERMHGERQAFNHYVQGTAADIQKMAIIRVHEALRPYGDKARICQHTHDSNVVEVHKSIPSAVLIPVIQKAMMLQVKGWLPLVVDSQVKQHLGGKK